MQEKKDVYVQKLKAKIDEWNAEIDLLASKANQSKADLKIGYLERIEELKEKRNELETKVKSLQEAGGSAWDELKDGLEESLRVWKDSFTKAKAAFGQGLKEGKEDKD
ncbi:MAG: hypothetical protein RBR38_12270 [Desulfomicrobium apsheronum]|nr:hypothetical protein [Desulfomicrobium apsheronum]